MQWPCGLRRRSVAGHQVAGIGTSNAVEGANVRLLRLSCVAKVAASAMD